MSDKPVTVVMDVGGTHTRMALAVSDGMRPAIERLSVIATPKGRLHEAVAEYLETTKATNVSAIAIAAAGRIRRLPGRTWVSLTNTSLSIEREDFQARHGIENVWLVNDLAAVAAALPILSMEDLLPLGSHRPLVPGHRLVVGVGTGFGLAALTADGKLLETESGHADLPAVSASERQWLDRMAPLGRLPIEQVLSGKGLLRLYEAVTRQPIDDHATLHERWAKQEAGALRTMSAFSTWLGRTVGNLVLSHGAWGGVVMVGGVIERLGQALDAQAFRQGFEDKSPFSSDLAAVPVWTVSHPQPALLGLAKLSLE